MNIQDDIEKEYLSFLASIQTELQKGNKQLTPDQQKKLIGLTAIIQEKRRIERLEKLRARPQAAQERISPRSHYQERETEYVEEKLVRLKPHYLRLLNEVFSPDCLNEVIRKISGYIF